MDTVKEEFACFESFFSPPHTSHKAWWDFLPPSKLKKGVGRRNNNSFGVQEEAVMTSGEYIQRRVCQAFVLSKKRSEKCVQIGLVLGKKKFKRNCLLLYLPPYFFKKYFPVSVGTHLVHHLLKDCSPFLRTVLECGKPHAPAVIHFIFLRALLPLYHPAVVIWWETPVRGPRTCYI